MDELLASLLLLDFYPGDLVRLAEDHDLEVGIGLVKIVKRDLTDISDMLDLLRALNGDKAEIIPSKPQLYVMWTGGKNLVPEKKPKSLWMYASDVAIYKKAVRTTEQ